MNYNKDRDALSGMVWRAVADAVLEQVHIQVLNIVKDSANPNTTRIGNQISDQIQDTLRAGVARNIWRELIPKIGKLSEKEN